MTEAEAHQLIFEVFAQMDSSFEFWVTGTFALVLVAHFGEERLSKSLSLFISFLYLSLTLLVLLRFGYVTDLLIEYRALANEVPHPTRFDQWFTITRPLILFSGTLGAIVYLWYFTLRKAGT